MWTWLASALLSAAGGRFGDRAIKTPHLAGQSWALNLACFRFDRKGLGNNRGTETWDIQAMNFPAIFSVSFARLFTGLGCIRNSWFRSLFGNSIDSAGKFFASADDSLGEISSDSITTSTTWTKAFKALFKKIWTVLSMSATLSSAAANAPVNFSTLLGEVLGVGGLILYIQIPGAVLICDSLR